MSTDRARSTYWVPMLGSALRILDAFYDSEVELSLHEVASIAKVGKTSAFRILFTLDKVGYVEKNPSNGKYHLGLKLISAARKTLSGGNLVQVARPYLLALRNEADETTNLAMLRKDEIIYLEIYESFHTFRMADTVGSRSPWHSTALGKVIAACLPADVVKAVLTNFRMKRFTANTICTPKDYLAALEKVRAQGYGLDNEENELGASCVAVAILNQEKALIGALSVSGPTPRIREKQNKIIAALRKTSTAISKLMLM